VGLRRLRLGSLLVVALALAGATVVPARDAGRNTCSIIWLAGNTQQAPVTATTDHRRVHSARRATSHTRDSQPFIAVSVRHALFQRPPPYLPAT
jgi:hypothetical protein